MRIGTVTPIPNMGSTVVAEIVPSSSKRVTLMIAISVGVGYVSCNASDLPLAGYPISVQSPLILTYESHGDMVRRAWYGSKDSTGAVFGVINVEEVA